MYNTQKVHKHFSSSPSGKGPFVSPALRREGLMSGLDKLFSSLILHSAQAPCSSAGRLPWVRSQPPLITHTQSAWPEGHPCYLPAKQFLFKKVFLYLTASPHPPFFFFFPSSHAISSFKLMSLWKQGFTTAFRSLYLLHKFPRTKSQGNQDSYIIKRSGAFLLR